MVIFTDIFFKILYYQMVIATRSKSKLNMSIAVETRNYFGSLIKSLVTNESLEKPLRVFQEKTVKRFEDKLDEWNPNIIELESKIAKQENAFHFRSLK